MNSMAGRAPSPVPPPSASVARLRAGFQHDIDEERRRLARSLHDSALQTLTAAAMNLSLVEREAAPLSTQARQAVVDAQALVESCARELRELSHALFPALLGSAGLAPALRWLARQRGEQRLRLALEPLPRFGLSVELAAYRLVEDAVGSIYDQEGTVEARVMAATEDVLEITLIGQARAQRDGSADIVIRQRVRAVGGRLRTRVVGGGLRLDVRFPPSVPDVETRSIGAR
jgi:signal transduction histidine kinase